MDPHCPALPRRARFLVGDNCVNRQAKENRSLQASVFSAPCEEKDARESDEIGIPPPPGLEHFAERPTRASRAKSESLLRSDSSFAEREREGTQWPVRHHE